MKNEDDQFNILRSISKNPKASQRNISKNLGLSLGKVNYCLQALKQKGLIKISNFRKSENKLKYAYVITPRGFTEKAKLTVKFMKRKMHEYDELKKESENS